MKKQIRKLCKFFVALVVVFGITACSGSSGGAKETDNKENKEQTQIDWKSEDTLVIYFSRTGEQYKVGTIDHGNTAIVAETIGETVDAELYEILPADDHYPMTYDELTDVAKQEQEDNARPAYEKTVPDLSKYQTIFIGAPVRWGDWPMIMYTFFEENAEALKDKTLIPFSTHEGSGLSGFDQKLRSACPDSTVRDGLAIQGSDAQNDPDAVKQEVEAWISSLGSE